MASATTSPTPEPSTRLSGLQLELLKLYSTELTKEETLELKQLLARHFARKAIAAADRSWDERKLTDQDMDAWLNE